MNLRRISIGLAAALCAAAASADVFNMGGGLTSLEMVTVGNSGNAADDTGYGAVDYEYRIGKYEVTAGQYAEFLNAVAKTDTHALYNTYMDHDAHPGYLGCNIKRAGTSGNYTYSVASDWANRPVNYVSFWDACRFANWLHNSQPTGAQGLATTEDGAYFLNGVTDPSNTSIARQADSKWAVTSEDEWYKAAYHKNDGVTGNYWDYPTSGNIVPGRDMNDAAGNNANFYQDGYLIGSPYYRTPVGEFEKSDSPYGTFDQGGNVWEWNESILYEWYRGLRGAAFDCSDDYGLLASFRGDYEPSYENYFGGLRVAEVPEPLTLSLLALGGLALIRRKRR